VEGIALKAAMLWGRGSIVVNYPLGERGRTPLFVVFYFHVGLIGLYIFFPISWKGWFLGTLTDKNENVNHWLKRMSISLYRYANGVTWKDCFTGNFEGKMNYLGFV
jgi:hypothetical protein